MVMVFHPPIQQANLALTAGCQFAVVYACSQLGAAGNPTPDQPPAAVAAAASIMSM
jgi:hypothetical protein